MKPKTRLIFSVVFNFLIFIFGMYAIISSILKGGEGNMDVYTRWQLFVYFTIDSNLFCAIASLTYGIYNLIILLRKEYDKDNKVIDLIKYISTVAVFLTFTTVVLFLDFIYGVFVFTGNNFFLHLLCPIMAVCGYIFFDSKITLKLKEVLLGVLPTFVYGVVYITMVVFIGHDRGGWYDFYMFNMGGFWPLSVIVMLSVTFGLAVLTNFLKKKIIKVR